MDGTRFDDIARQLGTARSRRGVLKTLGAATLGAIGVAGLGRAAEADTSGKVLVCHHTGSATNPYVLLSVSPNAVPAFAAQGDATNVNLQTDPNNCGSCGNVCTTLVADATATCSNGACGYTCNGDSYPSGGGCCFNYQAPDGACFWMENYSGNYCWVQNPIGITTKADCDAMNGCASGGCYRWATSSAG